MSQDNILASGEAPAHGDLQHHQRNSVESTSPFAGKHRVEDYVDRSRAVVDDFMVDVANKQCESKDLADVEFECQQLRLALRCTAQYSLFAEQSRHELQSKLKELLELLEMARRRCLQQQPAAAAAAVAAAACPIVVCGGVSGTSPGFCLGALPGIRDDFPLEQSACHDCRMALDLKAADDGAAAVVSCPSENILEGCGLPRGDGEQRDSSSAHQVAAKRLVSELGTDGSSSRQTEDGVGGLPSMLESSGRSMGPAVDCCPCCSCCCNASSSSLLYLCDPVGLVAARICSSHGAGGIEESRDAAESCMMDGCVSLRAVAAAGAVADSGGGGGSGSGGSRDAAVSCTIDGCVSLRAAAAAVAGEAGGFGRGGTAGGILGGSGGACGDTPCSCRSVSLAWLACLEALASKATAMAPPLTAAELSGAAEATAAAVTRRKGRLEREQCKRLGKMSSSVTTGLGGGAPAAAADTGCNFAGAPVSLVGNSPKVSCLGAMVHCDNAGGVTGELEAVLAMLVEVRRGGGKQAWAPSSPVSIPSPAPGLAPSIQSPVNSSPATVAALLAATVATASLADGSSPRSLAGPGLVRLSQTSPGGAASVVVGVDAQGWQGVVLSLEEENRSLRQQVRDLKKGQELMSLQMLGMTALKDPPGYLWQATQGAAATRQAPTWDLDLNRSRNVNQETTSQTDFGVGELPGSTLCVRVDQQRQVQQRQQQLQASARGDAVLAKQGWMGGIPLGWSFSPPAVGRVAHSDLQPIQNSANANAYANCSSGNCSGGAAAGPYAHVHHSLQSSSSLDGWLALSALSVQQPQVVPSSVDGSRAAASGSPRSRAGGSPGRSRAQAASPCEDGAEAVSSRRSGEEAALPCGSRAGASPCKCPAEAAASSLPSSMAWPRFSPGGSQPQHDVLAEPRLDPSPCRMSIHMGANSAVGGHLAWPCKDRVLEELEMLVAMGRAQSKG